MNDLKKKKLFLLDMDGTIYIDNRLFPGVTELLSEIKANGGRYLFMTNNSSMGVASYEERLNNLGIQAQADDFLTSVDGLIHYLNRVYGEYAKKKKIYLVGTESLAKQLIAQGFSVWRRVDILGEDVERADILILGFDRELSFEKLEAACVLLTREKRAPGLKPIDYIATNPDWVCPTWYGYVPDCGSIIEMLKKATGKSPVVIGKPKPEMVYLAMDKYGFSKEKTIIIGDRIYTDIACGVNAGIDSIFVLSGEGVPEDIEKYSIEPTYTMEGIWQVMNKINEG